MATPIGHSLVALAIHRLCGGATTLQRPASVLLTVALANAPDLDLLPGLLLGAPALYHQGPTHSLGTAVAVSVTTAALVSAFTRDAFRPRLRLFFLAYVSHLALDLVGPDHRPPIGIPVLWPLRDTPVLSPVPLLLGVRHARSTADATGVWLASLAHPYNIAAVSLEVLLFLPLVILAGRASLAATPKKRRV